jgi:hypothetical protein
LELYAEPRPTVELIVPTGYHGLVKAEIQVQDDLIYPAGQRCFRYAVPASGVVPVTVPPLLRMVFPPDFHARYADGTALTNEAKGAEIGFWWVNREGNIQCFLVGTLSEYDAVRRSYRDEPGKRQASGGSGKGGGRGGGRRHGGSPDPSNSPAPDSGMQ